MYSKIVSSFLVSVFFISSFLAADETNDLNAARQSGFEANFLGQHVELSFPLASQDDLEYGFSLKGEDQVFKVYVFPLLGEDAASSLDEVEGMFSLLVSISDFFTGSSYQLHRSISEWNDFMTMDLEVLCLNDEDESYFVRAIAAPQAVYAMVLESKKHDGFNTAVIDQYQEAAIMKSIEGTSTDCKPALAQNALVGKVGGAWVPLLLPEEGISEFYYAKDSWSDDFMIEVKHVDQPQDVQAYLYGIVEDKLFGIEKFETSFYEDERGYVLEASSSSKSEKLTLLLRGDVLYVMYSEFGPGFVIQHQDMVNGLTVE